MEIFASTFPFIFYQYPRVSEQELHGVKHLKLSLYTPGVGFQEWSTGHRAVLKEGGYLKE